MKRKLPNSVFSLILTTLTIVSWIFFSIYQTLKKPLPVVIPPEISQPIEANLGLETIEKIKNRKYFEEGSFKETIIETPTPPSIETSTQNEATPQAAIKETEPLETSLNENAQ